MTEPFHEQDAHEGESPVAPPEPAGDASESLASAADEASNERTRSTIAFPYAGLADAEAIAAELHGFGGAATPEGIAEARGQQARSGAFRQKLAAARIFGIVATRPGQVALTQLGNKIIDPEQRDAARVDAFLHVPLYKAIFEQYQGNLLPPADALESRMVALGVSAKQAAVARQVFQRSAELAGFFRRGANRLTLPENVSLPQKQRKQPRAQDGTADAASDALQALWLTLLRDGESWSAEQTKQYVDGARRVYGVLEGQR